jgi:hypothetical protein
VASVSATPSASETEKGPVIPGPVPTGMKIQPEILLVILAVVCFVVALLWAAWIVVGACDPGAIGRSMLIAGCRESK